jgi:hypothetical protein
MGHYSLSVTRERILVADERVKYYAVVDRWANRDSPAGILRRRWPSSGGFRDEAFSRDLTWEFSPIIVEWERAESSDNLIEVSEGEAERIIERFRDRWGATS